MSVWDDVRVRVYVAGASDGFFEYASSMAAHSSSSSDALDETVVPRQGQMARLTRADVDRAGLVIDPGDTVIGRTGHRGRHDVGARVLRDDQRRCARAAAGLYRHPARVPERRADDQQQPDRG